MGSLTSSFTTKANYEGDACKSFFVRRTALELFVSKGFQSVSLRQLAEAVGIQAGSLYNHIESKQTLLFDFIEELDSLLLHAVEIELKVQRDAVESLKQFLRAYMTIALENRSLYLLSRREMYSLGAEQQADIKRLRLKLMTALVRVIYSGRTKGLFQVHDDRLTAGAIGATLEGALTRDWGDDICVSTIILEIQNFVLQAVATR